MIKRFFFYFLKSSIAVLAASACAAVALTLVFLIPVNEDKYEMITETLESEGWYPNVLNIKPLNEELFFSNNPGILDGGGTDKVFIVNNTLVSSEENVFRAAMDMNDYAYYWHGYVLVLRIAFRFLNLEEYRMVNLFVQILLVFVAMSLICRRKSMAYSMLFFTSYLFLMPQALGMSLQYSPVFYISAMGVLCLLCGKSLKMEKVAFLFLLLGMLTSFFDLLTYPLLSWGMPIIWWTVLCDAERREKVRGVVISGLMWIYGYAGFWCMKWIWGSLILKKPIFNDAVQEVIFRSGNGGGNYSFKDRLDAILVNACHYRYKVYFIILLLWMLYIVGSFILNKIEKGNFSWALLLTAVSPLAWYFVLAQHTAEHHFFTYRIFSILLTAAIALFLELDSHEKRFHFSS